MARATEANELPCLELLEATPDVLRGLLSGLSEEDAKWKPAADRFSIAQVLGHLSHAEGHCYRARLDRFWSEDRPVFESYDALTFFEAYRDADPEDAFNHLEEQRETNLEFLRSLPAGAAARVALHTDAGEITLGNMLHEWAMHDLSHVRQIAELVRARKCLAGAGPLGRYHRVNP